MRIAFIFEDSGHGDALKKAAANAAEQSSGIEFVNSPVPELLKAPVIAKRALSDCECAIIVVHAESEMQDALSLLNSKIVDVELARDKLAFLEVVFDDDWKTEDELTGIAERKIKDALRKAARFQPHASEMPSWMPGQNQEEVKAPAEQEEDALGFMQDEVGDKLF